MMRKLSSLSRQLLSEEADNTFQSKKRMQQKHTTLNIPQLLTLKYWKKKTQSQIKNTLQFSEFSAKPKHPKLKQEE
jgi:hypothetical protein